LTATVTPAPIREALEGAVGALAAAGVESPRLDAELLLCEATGWERAQVASEPEAGLPAGAGREFAAMVRRRLRREPLAYITGRKGFRRIELAVDRRALIPRPETELLVEVAVELAPGSVLETGTGSGAVALAVADELPEATVVATDSSAAALELARENAVRLGVAERIRFEPGTVPDGESFDLLLANLPYVAEAEWDGLAPEIREFEPREALVAGADGLDAIRSLLAAVSPALASKITLEVGAGQADVVGEMIGAAGYPSIDIRKDLAGIERVVVGS
jgi:release factor glutamine methyltransferase